MHKFLVHTNSVKMDRASFCCLAYFLTVQCSIYLVYSSSVGRLADDTRACQWRPWSSRHEHFYKEIEELLNKINQPIPIIGVDRFYEYIIELAVNHIEEASVHGDGFHNELRIWTFTLLSLTKTLDERDCLDHCTHVLARNSCNAGYYNHSCMSRSTNPSILKAMIDSKVFPMMNRCQKPLMERAIELNRTEIDPQTYETVTFITDQMTKFDANRQWETIEDIMLRSKKPFLTLRQLIKPHQTGFLFNLARIMLKLETRVGGDSVMRMKVARSPDKDETLRIYQRLILHPCLEFIDKLHVVMDGATFYGKMMDMDQNRFTMPSLDDEMRLKFFQLVHRYNACTCLDNLNPWDLMNFLNGIVWYS